MNRIREAALGALEKARRYYELEEPAWVEIDISLRGRMAVQAGWRPRRVGANLGLAAAGTQTGHLELIVQFDKVPASKRKFFHKLNTSRL